MLSLLGLAGVVAPAATAATAAQREFRAPAADLTEWHIDLLPDEAIPAMCDTPWCKSHTQFDGDRFAARARWLVGDRCTNQVRYFCDECVEEFRRRPVRLLEAAPIERLPLVRFNERTYPQQYVSVTEAWVREQAAHSGVAALPRSWQYDHLCRRYIVPADDPTLHVLASGPFKHYFVGIDPSMDPSYPAERTTHAPWPASPFDGEPKPGKVYFTDDIIRGWLLKPRTDGT